MKKLLSVFVLTALCGSLAAADTIEENRKIVLEGEVLASEISNPSGKLSEMFVTMIIRHEGEIYNCLVQRIAVLCFEFGKYD